MPILKVILSLGACVLFYIAGYYSAPVNECKDEYKDAYMNHIELCDTLHEKCFRIGN